MKLYQTIDGTLIGFYQELGGAVQCTSYRDVYEQQLVTKERQEQFVMAGYYETYDIVTPGYWKEEEVFIPGHYERQMVWHPEYSVTRYREVPGHYEIQPYWFEEYSVTRYMTIPAHWEEYEVTRPADPVTGRIEVTYMQSRWVEEEVIEYEEVMPAGYKDTRVWVNTYTEEYEEIIEAGEKETRVWVDDRHEIENVWVKETTRAETVWIEPTIGTRTVEYQELEQVWVGHEPIYEYIDPIFVQAYEVLELVPAPPDRPDLEDSIKLRNTLTGEELTTTATYVGLGTKIDENEYVVP